MLYILSTLLMLLGVGFHIMQKVSALRIKFPEFSFRRIWGTFFTQEWDTLCVSFLCWLVYELAIFVTLLNHVKVPVWVASWGVYAIALVWGYAGQRLAYKYLGTAEEVLTKRADLIKENKL